MEYTVTSPNGLYSKKQGEKFTEQELLSKGATLESIQRHIKKGNLKTATNVPKVQQVTKQEPQVQKEEPEAFVFNKYNYEGDK